MTPAQERWRARGTTGEETPEDRPAPVAQALAPEVADVLRSALEDRADAVAEELLASTIDAWRDHGLVSCAEMPVYGERFAAALAAEVEHGS